MNTHSAWVAANSRPRSDEPAWKSSGVRCGEGSERCGPRDLVIRAGVVDGVDSGGVGVAAARGVAEHRVLLPASLPELVGDLQVLLGAGVALVVGRQSAEAEVGPRVGQVGGHDVPGDPAAGDVIQRRDLAGEGEGRHLQHRAGEGEAQVLGRRRHGRDQRHGIVGRDLHRLDDRGLRPGAIEVVGADHVREEERIEAAALKQPGELDPGLDPVELALARVVPHPEAVLDVGDAVHRERVEVDAFAHRRPAPKLRPRASMARPRPLRKAVRAPCYDGCTRGESFARAGEAGRKGERGRRWPKIAERTGRWASTARWC